MEDEKPKSILNEDVKVVAEKAVALLRTDVNDIISKVRAQAAESKMFSDFSVFTVDVPDVEIGEQENARSLREVGEHISQGIKKLFEEIKLTANAEFTQLDSADCADKRLKLLVTVENIAE